MAVQQQTVLRDAMRRLNMTRDTFANRIGVSRRALDTWLLPDDSQRIARDAGDRRALRRRRSRRTARPTAMNIRKA